MICRLQDIEINDERPFQNCKLGRKKYADILEKVVSFYFGGCVLAINGEWGTGKTTFVRMWQKYLENRGFKTLYFNVWKHDFISDPLVGLVGELKNLDTSAKTKYSLASVVQASSKILGGMFPALVKGIIKKSVGDDVLEVIEKGAEAASEVFAKEIEDYTEKCNTLEEFRNAMIDLVESCDSDKPLVFIVDELDRCNPAFAVKVLERIKHLFSIPNMVFVLSIDKKQLCNSIRGYYGSDLIDAEEYLKRFIDIEYLLPDPDLDKLCNYLFDVYGFEFFFDASTKNRSLRNGEKDSFLRMTKLLMEYKKLNIRQMEKLYAHTRLAMQTVRDDEYAHPEIVFLLVYFRLFDFEYYDRIKRKVYTISELVELFENIFPENLLKPLNEYDRTYKFMVGTIAKILSCYSLLGTGIKTCTLLTEKEGAKILTFEPKKMPKDDLLFFLEHYERQGVMMGSGIFDLNYLFNHIDLLNGLQNYGEC